MKQIFVFGSNREGRHGKGAALHARLHHGAVYGQARGLQGDSYAIVTKELRRGTHPPVTLEEIAEEVKVFIEFARAHSQTMSFFVTAIGCGLAGFTPSQIAPFFKDAPSNIFLPTSFSKVINDLKVEVLKR